MRGNTISIQMPLVRGKVSKTIPLYQWDYGQRLVFTDVELPAAYEVHFSNEMHGDAVTSIGGSTGVDIPDVCLQDGGPVYLWLFLHDTELDGETEFQGVIPVIRRAKPSDDVPTPEQASAISQAITALNDAVTSTSADVATTAANVLKSEGYALGKQDGVDVGSDSPYYQNNSLYFAGEASNSADDSADSAEQAAAWATGSFDGEGEEPVTEDDPQYENNAAYYADQAGDYAEDAEAYGAGTRGGVDVSSGDDAYHNNAPYYAQQAASSATSANSAKGDATSAKNAAVSAKTAAETAQAAAESWATGGSSGTPSATNNAKYYSEQAASSATTASEKAGLAATSESNASGSASTAGTKALVSEGYAVGKQNGEDVASGSTYYHNNAEYYAGQASSSATAASGSADAASGSASSASTNALKSEGYAVGSQNGTDVTSGSPYYQNNAKYYAGVAEDVLESIPEDYSTLSSDVTNLKSAIDAHEKCDADGYRRAFKFINGSYSEDTLAISANTKRIIASEFIEVKKGDIITVKPGSFTHATSLFAGTTTSYTLIKKGNTFSTDNETIRVYVDGFFNVYFANASNLNAVISASDFDGSITVTSYAKTKADNADLKNLKDGYQVTHSNILDNIDCLSTGRYWSKISGTNILTLTATGTYSSWLIPVDGTSIYTFKYQTRYIYPVGSDGVTTVGNVAENVTSIDTSQYTGCSFLAISVNNSTYDMDTYCVSKGSTAKKDNTYTYPAWFNGKFDPLEDKVDDLEDELEAFEDGYEVVNNNLLEDLTPTSETQYYYKSTQTGKLVLATSDTATYNSWLVPVDGTSKYTMSYTTRFVLAVENDGETVIGTAIDSTTSIDTSQYTGCKYIAISLRTDNLPSDKPLSEYYVSKGNVARTGTETIPPAWFGDKLDDLEDQINSLDVKPKKNKVFMLTDTSFSAEKNFTDFATSAKGKCMHLVVNLSSFTSVTVGLRDATRPVFYAQVTSDSVYLYDYNGGNTAHTQTYAHGLTIADNLSIDVYSAPNQNLYYVQVGTNGTEYTTPDQFSIGPTGLIYPYASMEGSASFVQFSAECNTQRPIWLFGDSYLGTYNTARWAYYLVNREKDSRVMMDSYAGENSTSAFASLEKLIECGVPDYIVWCLGMNDGGDSGTTPNSTWLGYIESMLALCEENNITPILATIPTVPSINNEGKNAWVRESGYQYIDFAKAVGASDQGVWFDGMQSTDNVHPSVTGAVTLYHAALAGCPQFSQK